MWRASGLQVSVSTRRRMALARLASGSFLAGAVVLLAGSLWVGGELAAPAPAAIGPPPSDLPAAEVRIPSPSGSTLSGWFVPGSDKRGVILLFHPYRDNRLAMLDRARFLRRAGYSILLVDFQAHGESPGEHITFGRLESRDVQAAVEHVLRRRPGEPIGAIGVSLGGAALALAGPLGIDAAVLEAVYPTIEEAVENRIRRRLGPLASALTPLLLVQLGPRLGFSPRELRPIDGVHDLRCPLLVVQGSEDGHTTLDEARRLFAAAAEPKALWAVEGAGHVDLHRFQPRAYEERILGFFRQHLRTKGKP